MVAPTTFTSSSIRRSGINQGSNTTPLRKWEHGPHVTPRALKTPPKSYARRSGGFATRVHKIPGETQAADDGFRPEGESSVGISSIGDERGPVSDQGPAILEIGSPSGIEAGAGPGPGLISTLKREFVKVYGGSREDIWIFFAPGRVNLIREHTDYNGGFVLPAAISMGIYAAVRFDGSDSVTFTSLNEPGTVTISLHGEILFDPSHGWANYPKGVLKNLMKDGYEVQGCKALY